MKHNEERVFRGLGVSPGIAIGPLHLRESGKLRVVEKIIGADEIDDELTRFRQAVVSGRKQLEKLKTKAQEHHGNSADELEFLLDAHEQMLNSSRLHTGVEIRIRKQRINAEAAVFGEVQTIAEAFSAMNDPYLSSRGEEVRQVGNRILRALTKTGFMGFGELPASSIVAAEEITPADTALMDPEKVAGFASEIGGAEGHTAIMARSLGIPAVLGLTGLMEATEPGSVTIIDGSQGLVVLNPSAERLAEYRRRQENLLAETRALVALRNLPAETLDGEHLSLKANLELPNEVTEACETGAEGVGLLRTEFCFMNRKDLPSQAEQESTLTEIVTGMGGQPVTIRTLDVGGEKLASALGSAFGEAQNPAMGLRAIRLSLQQPELLEDQFHAILQAATAGPVRVLLPMVSHVEELREARRYMEVIWQQREEAGLPLPVERPLLGAMIEIPGAAVAADWLAQEADFFAIGTNDLISYTLGIDRSDEQVAHLYNPLHPAVLRLIRRTVEAALHAEIPVSICGEMAGDPRYTAFFIGLGVRELSMRAKAIPIVKRRVRALNARDTRLLAEQMLSCKDQNELSNMLTAFNNAAGF